MTTRADRPSPVGSVEASTVAIYEGTVQHHRFVPTPSVFTPRLFLAYLDLDALPSSLDALPLWSARRRAPVRFRASDFFDGRDRPLGDAVRGLVHARLGRRPEGPVHLLAQLRTFGWLANPLAVYYCWTADRRELDSIVLEVTNTPWGERHWYVLDAQGDERVAMQSKAMHVSPFLPMDLDYRIEWTVPSSSLALRIDVQRDRVPVFAAELALRRVDATPRSAVAVLARYPLQPTLVSAGIYAKAAQLLARRLRVYSHPKRQRPRSARCTAR